MNDLPPIDINAITTHFLNGTKTPEQIRERAKELGYDDDSIDEAIRLADKNVAEKNAVAERVAKQKAAIKARMQSRAEKTVKKLRNNDTSVTVPLRLLEAMEAQIKELMDDDVLETYNAELRQKSGSITHKDIAFIAVIHWDSVTRNAKPDNIYCGTSPFKRIVKASTAIYGRETPFDYRQVRTALAILFDLEFTRELHPAVFKFGGDKNENKAGVWVVSKEHMWTSIFDQK